ELRDTYFDSSDWMIYRAGFALRFRRTRTGPADEVSEITLKSLRKSRGGVTRRTEISQRVEATDIHAVLGAQDGIGERIRELIGSRPLGELFSARTRRERQCLLEAETDLPLAEVDLDETTLETPGGAVQSLQRVEVECLNAEPAAIDAVVQEFRAAANLAPVDSSKFTTGLALAGLKPESPRLPGPITILATQPFAESMAAILRRYFAMVIESEPDVRAGSSDSVHDMRVAARHLDAILRATHATNPLWVNQAHGPIRSLIKRLGDVRDCDVQLAHLEVTVKEMVAAEREALKPLRARLVGERDRARERLLRELDSPRALATRATWRARLAESTPASGPRSEATAVVALELVSRQVRKLRKRADALIATSTADDYHRVRISAKRARYVLDAFERLYGPTARDFADALGRLQTVLGKFHDAAVRGKRYAELAASAALPPETAFSIGRIVERDSTEFEKCRRKFPKAYRRVRGRRWRELRAAMRRQAKPVETAGKK
ncbi:MAG: CHAD domain-containing protein, partial [Steroidobacteraceae bacterium]|nr:CHAD domain-containing protein [Steroidobacteraceae bacterium]